MGDIQQHAPEPVERLVKQLLVTYKAVKLYPPASSIPRESAADALAQLDHLLRARPDVRFTVTRDGLLYDGKPVLPGRQPFADLSLGMWQRGVGEVRLHAGIDERELTEFLAVLQEPIEEIAGAGGIESRLWERRIDGITVLELRTTIVDGDAAQVRAAHPAETPLSLAQVERLLGIGRGMRPIDRRSLVRFAQDPAQLGEYLRGMVAAGDGADIGRLATTVEDFARLARDELAQDQPLLQRSIAEAIMALPAALRFELLSFRLLEDARSDESLAEVVRQLDVRELCDALVAGLTDDPASREGLSRAIRNLTMIGLASRSEVLAAARDALEKAATPGVAIAAVLEGAAPTTLNVPDVRSANADAVIEALKLVDLAPQAGDASADPAAAALHAEALRGVSDGDVLATVVSVASFERRPDVFDAMISLVEGDLGLLVGWAEYAEAAYVAAVLVALADDETLLAAQRNRVTDALATLASPAALKLVSGALRVYDPASEEHRSCRELIRSLSSYAIKPLLEVLAAEQDMAARKALVDLLSELAPDNIALFGASVGDERWYFVRNVVNILGNTRRADAIPYLTRTLRHGDARVRRETIRALSATDDRLAEELLVTALADDDEQNVRLAARYLGGVGARCATAALIGVARGETRGSRDVGARTEAIEALGRIATPEAIEALGAISRQRVTLRGGRAREVKAAAEAALAAARTAAKAGGGRR